MTAIEKLVDKLNIEIDDTYKYNMYDLEISTYNTADGYEVYIMKNLNNDIEWENDVFYYQPSFDDIMTRIMELDKFSSVYVSDIEEFMPDYEIEQWINDNEDSND